MDIYYAIFSPDDDGWSVRFPDAPSVNTCGETVEESLAMAVDALSAIMVLGRKGLEYEAPRPYVEIKKEAKQGGHSTHRPPHRAPRRPRRENHLQ